MTSDRTCEKHVPDFEIGDDKQEKLTKIILEMYSENKQSEPDFYKKLEILSKFENLLIKEGIREQLEKYGGKFHRVVPYGSAVTDLAMKKCDFDMCIAVESSSNRLSPNEVLSWVINVLDNDFPFPGQGTYELISGATVPIIRIKSDVLEIDISASVGLKPPSNIKAVQMINSYSQLDFRFSLLCSFVRQWFKHLSLFHVSSRTATLVLPNSYSTTLLVIHFLQYYGILPILFKTHPKMFDPVNSTWQELVDWQIDAYTLSKKDIEKWTSTPNINKEVSLGALFVAFLDYYINIVSLPKDVIVAKNGKVKQKKSSYDNGLVILDSYDAMNPGRRLANVKLFETILRQGFELIRTCGDPDEMFEELWNLKIDNNNVRKHKKGLSQSEKEEARKNIEANAKPYVDRKYDESWNPIEGVDQPPFEW